MPGRIDGLRRERIAREALALIDEEGLGALTMRAVAARIGVGTMSLYHHVPNKDELVADIVDAVLSEIEIPPPQDGDWRAPLRAALTSARQAILRHPAALPLLLSRQPRTAAALGAVDAGIGALLRAGYDVGSAARVTRCMASYLLGYVSLELASGQSAARNSAEAEQLAAAYPHLAAAVPHLIRYDADADFDANLQALLAALSREPRAGDGTGRDSTLTPSPHWSVTAWPE